MDNTSQTVLTLFSINPNHEEVAIGVIYSTLALLIVPLYAPVIYVMTTDEDLRSNPQYRLMNQINYLDLGQAVCHFFSGIFVIFPQVLEKAQVLVRITGCTANSLWLAMFPVMSVLSISRILIIRNITQPNKIPEALKAAMVIGWLYVIGVWLWGCITQNFTLTGVGWSYDSTKLGAPTLSALEWYLCFPSLGLTYVAYVIIVIHVEATQRSTARSNRKQEVKIFLQATLLCCYMSTLIIIWHNAEDWFYMTTTTIAILNSAWICFSFLNPLLLIALNQTIRNKVMAIRRCRKKKAFSTAVVSYTSKTLRSC